MFTISSDDADNSIYNMSGNTIKLTLPTTMVYTNFADGTKPTDLTGATYVWKMTAATGLTAITATPLDKNKLTIDVS